MGLLRPGAALVPSVLHGLHLAVSGLASGIVAGAVAGLGSRGVVVRAFVALRDVFHLFG